MTYRVVFTKRAKKQIKKLDPQIAHVITGWLRKNIEGCKDPRVHGKSLTGEHKGEWRYRIGTYRVIVNIQDDEVIVLVLGIGHRKGIY